MKALHKSELIDIIYPNLIASLEHKKFYDWQSDDEWFDFNEFKIEKKKIKRYSWLTVCNMTVDDGDGNSIFLYYEYELYMYIKGKYNRNYRIVYLYDGDEQHGIIMDAGISNSGRFND